MTGERKSNYHPCFLGSEVISFYKWRNLLFLSLWLLFSVHFFHYLSVSFSSVGILYSPLQDRKLPGAIFPISWENTPATIRGCRFCFWSPECGHAFINRFLFPTTSLHTILAPRDTPQWTSTTTRLPHTASYFTQFDRSCFCFQQLILLENLRWLRRLAPASQRGGPGSSRNQFMWDMW
jgi:hypothetical protein